jgi:hypothetical protein
MKFIFAFFFIHIVTFSTNANLLQCFELFKREPFQDVQNFAPLAVRSKLTEYLRANKDIPAMIKTTVSGDVPVILVNNQTLPKLRSLLERSAGFMFVQQVGYRNDHGLMRAGNYIIDVDTPGARGYGELHQTGLAWKSIDTYIPRRGDQSYVMIETGYLMSKEDLQTLEFYQKLRRAAVFRIPFTFGGAARKDFPNMLENSGENCFGFCKGATVENDIVQIKNKILRLSPGLDIERMMNSDSMKTYFDMINKVVLKANVDDPDSLHWGMINGDRELKILEDVIPKQISKEAQQVFINWVVALEANKKYLALKKKYQISTDGGYQDINNGQVSFVLIYDSMLKKDLFLNGNYSSPGVFWSWDARNQVPLR